MDINFKLFSKAQSLATAINSINFSNNSNFISISSLYGAKPFFISELSKKNDKMLVVSSDKSQLNELYSELKQFELKNVFKIDENDIDSISEKLGEFYELENFIVLILPQIFSAKFPDKNIFGKSVLNIGIENTLNYDDIIELLNSINYQNVQFVESPGDYAVRGSIIDIWSYCEKSPVRLEYDFDDIASLRYFDPTSQRSISKIKNFKVSPSFETIEEQTTGNIFDYVQNALVLADYSDFTENLIEETKNQDLVEESDVDEELKDDILHIEVAQTEVKTTIDFDEIKNKAKWIFEDSLKMFDNRIDLGITNVPQINSNYLILFKVIEDFIRLNYRIYICTENQFQYDRLKELIENKSNFFLELINSGNLKIVESPLSKGFEANNDKILYLTDYQIFNKPYRVNQQKKHKDKKSVLKNWSAIKIGDYVVHEQYGIAKYLGLEKIKIGETEQESIKLTYADGDIVYVNVNYLHLVKKFSAQDGVQPNLSNLNSPAWERTKQKIKKQVKEFARDLIKLYAQRKMTKGFQFSPDNIWQKELEASFIYEDTPDQRKVTDEIKEDLMSENPMDRLLCGDVGFGKTEIAVRAAFKAIQDSKQVAVLVPTTILAEQHFNTFSDRMNQFPIRIGHLSRFVSKAQQNETLEKLKEGQLDILIGTHRILSEDVKYKDLGLLIIDEEHRFGVQAKEKLRKLKVNVDTLTMTATPIPRTLNFSLLGARDLSLITTPPPNRLPVRASVEVFNITKVREYIIKEVTRGGQVFFIHDRVQTINKMKDYLQKYIPEVRYGIAHGQMKPQELEKVISNFITKKIDVILCTKIVESGIDIPNANTMIINRADRFGLAELYQLKGRVGRTNKQAFAYFLVPSLSSITKKARLRLQAIEEYSDLGEGLNLAMRDLEIRGAGNLLGTEQSGTIENVGFDLYIKLIEESVNELKNDEFKDVFQTIIKQKHKTDATVDAFFEIEIPSLYMPNPSDRFMFYTALFSANSIENIKELEEEMEDRFGKIPEIVQNLILLAELKFYASYSLFDKVIIKKDQTIFVLPESKANFYYEKYFQNFLTFLAQNYTSEFKLHQDKLRNNDQILKVIFKNNHKAERKLIEDLLRFCKHTSQFMSSI